MKWSEEKVKQLRDLAFAGKSNKEIARALGVEINEVYAERSQLGITIDKVKATQAEGNHTRSLQAFPDPVLPKQRTTGEITRDLRLQFRSLSTALGEIDALFVELFDILNLLDDTPEMHYECPCGKTEHYADARYCTNCGRKIEKPQ